MSILYLDIVGGIAGDMTVAALLELGVPLDLIRDGLAALGMDGLVVEAETSHRHELKGTRFLVHPPSAQSGSHQHRDYQSIRKMISESRLPEGAKNYALKVFSCLAEAEGAVHGVPPEQVTFHEVGAWDSIADVVGVALGIDHLAPEAIYCSSVPLGAGQIKSAHGVIPIPAPATLQLLKGFTVIHGGPAYERTTPTGAALLAALAHPAPDPFAFVPQQVGIGLGKLDPPEVPNLLRAVLGRVAKESREVVECAEVNLDDANPEWIGYAVERLLEIGVLDVATIPLNMKKNRPAIQIQVIYPPGLRDRVMDLLFSETTTLGVRYHTMDRIVLAREKQVVSTPWGEVGGKVFQAATGQRFAPEYEDCREVARRAQVPLQDVYQAAHFAFRKK